jgi:hypothetical protein
VQFCVIHLLHRSAPWETIEALLWNGGEDGGLAMPVTPAPLACNKPSHCSPLTMTMTSGICSTAKSIPTSTIANATLSKSDGSKTSSRSKISSWKSEEKVKLEEDMKVEQDVKPDQGVKMGGRSPVLPYYVD